MAFEERRFDNVVAALRAWSERQPDRPLYTFLRSAEAEPETLSYAQADARARGLAVRLREYAQPGDRALLLYPSSLEYPVAFLACMYAGLVAVPAYPPDPRRARASLPRIHAIAADCGPRLILTTASLCEVCELARSQSRDPDQVEVLATDVLDEGEHWSCPDELRDGLAFLQYTSGSTRTPRGVMVGHANLAEHQRYAHRIFRQGPEATTVSWLPFYHDMGLIGSLLYPLWSGGHSVLMPPTSFLRRPVQWLHTLSRYRAQVSTGPNFAYDLCVRKATEEDMHTLDLSQWELTVCGAEPLRYSTLRSFADKFGPVGFRATAFLPCWGGAEATLTMSGTCLNEVPLVRWFDEGELRRDRIVARERFCPGSRPYVACGVPMDEHELVVVTDGKALPEDRVGELWLRGPSVNTGYWNDIVSTRRTFEGRLEGDPTAYLRTDDLGFVHQGRVFVIGRVSDRIVIQGERHEPHEIEITVEQSEVPLGDGTVAAFQTPDEDLVIAVEVRKTRTLERREAIARKVAALVAQRHGAPPTRVLLIAPRTVPRTSSGKIRRHAYRQAYVRGELATLTDYLPIVA